MTRETALATRPPRVRHGTRWRIADAGDDMVLGDEPIALRYDHLLLNAAPNR